LDGIFGHFYQHHLSPSLSPTKAWRRGGHGVLTGRCFLAAVGLVSITGETKRRRSPQGGVDANALPPQSMELEVVCKWFAEPSAEWQWRSRAPLRGIEVSLLTGVWHQFINRENRRMIRENPIILMAFQIRAAETAALRGIEMSLLMSAATI